jgi:hypothetical protein
MSASIGACCEVRTMPNLFQRIGGAIGRVFGRGEEAPTPAPAPEPQPERPGFFERLNPFARARREREELERERQAIEERARQVEARERQLEELRRNLAEQERQREEREREERERTQPRQAVRQPAEPGIPPDLAAIPAILPLGPKGREGAAYTTISSDVVMARLRDAADLGKRVSLRVHDARGWHDLFLNDKPGKGPAGYHKPARGITAGYLVDQIGDDFDQWIDDGGAVGEEGDTSPDGDEGFENVDGYQLTVWS